MGGPVNVCNSVEIGVSVGEDVAESGMGVVASRMTRSAILLGLATLIILAEFTNV